MLTSELQVPVQSAVVVGLEHGLHGPVQAVCTLLKRGEDEFKPLVVVLGQHKQGLCLAWEEEQSQRSWMDRKHLLCAMIHSMNQGRR